jgi:hypothetical protein
VRRLLVALARDTAPGGAADDPAVEVELRLQPARRAAGPPLTVRASVGAVRDERGKLLGVAWMLQVPTQPSAPLPSPGRRRLGWVAADHRVGALLAVPVLADEDRPDDTVAAGVVELVIHHPHRWTGEEVRAAVAHGATLSRLLRAGLAAGQANERLAHLLRVLDSRVVVEQAKGMLMERDQLLPAQAFRVLRAMAKLSNRRISDVAADVIADRAR